MSARRSDRLHFNTLQIVFKVVERCNINCSYCYYFNSDDRSAYGRPAIIDLERVKAVADYLATGVLDLKIKRVLVSFHGGEPMLLKPRIFSSTCEIIKKAVDPVAKLGFIIQTNGTILSEEWVELFKRFSVNVGISIDGHQEAHDKFRLDHRGQSTFKKTEQTLNALTQASLQMDVVPASTISVIHCSNDYQEIYSYLRGRGVRSMSFLLPDRTVDQGFDVGEGPIAYGEALAALVDAWFDEDDPSVEVRQIKNVLNYFQEIQPLPRDDTDLDSSGSRMFAESRSFLIAVIQSDGVVVLNDSYMPAVEWYAKAGSYSVSNSSLRDFVDLPIQTEIDRVERSVSEPCKKCKWVGICKGGDLENRFSSDRSFDNPSIYCDGLKIFYERIIVRLQMGGYPQQSISDKLEQLKQDFLSVPIEGAEHHLVGNS